MNDSEGTGWICRYLAGGPHDIFLDGEYRQLAEPPGQEKANGIEQENRDKYKFLVE